MRSARYKFSDIIPPGIAMSCSRDVFSRSRFVSISICIDLDSYWSRFVLISICIDLDFHRSRFLSISIFIDLDFHDLDFYRSWFPCYRFSQQSRVSSRSLSLSIFTGGGTYTQHRDLFREWGYLYTYRDSLKRKKIILVGRSINHVFFCGTLPGKKMRVAPQSLKGFPSGIECFFMPACKSPHY